ncbi:MAG: hypothetical protein NTZ35_08825 [Ignavibacteriales bacterium]|nr:hypothetical protein [Ignavibacteriales bacterium]
MKEFHATPIVLAISAATLVASFTGCYTLRATYYSADYNISLYRVERPEKATQRYGSQKVDILSGTSKYKFSFEDDLVKILWMPGSSQIAFSLQNKTDHSIKIPWDEAAFVDENGGSHRVMHSGVKYTDRENPQAPSIVVRKGMIEDIVFPTDHVHWNERNWEEDPLLLDSDYHSNYSPGTYPTFKAFANAVKSNVGKTYQVLLPLQIEDVINDYIFSFKVENVQAKQDSISRTVNY